MTTSVPPSTAGAADAALTDSTAARPLGAEGIGETDVDDGALVVIDRLGPAPGPIDDLIGHDDGPGHEVGLERADRARREHLPHAERAQRPQIGAIVHPVRREPVPRPWRARKATRRPSTSPTTTGSDGGPKGSPR